MKDKVICGLIIAIVSVALFIVGFSEKHYNTASKVYQVYLNGNKIGMIKNENDLYDIINDKQLEIKKKYNVDKVYPPKGFDIVKSYSYQNSLNDVNDIYKQIEDADDFTIKGYTIVFHPTEVDEETNEVKPDVVINVLDRKIFDEAILKFVYSFVKEDEYKNYINNTQEPIKDVGKIIENMYFNETISIKESYISVNDKIFTDATELTQYLLFGDNVEQKKYTIKDGDTIASISETNELNPQEFLIANPKYRDVNSLLAIGDEVSINLINPKITLTYEVYEVEDAEQIFEKKVEYDSSKPSSYSKVTQEGINGITRLTETYKVVNGEDSIGLVVTNRETIRETVNQITTKGKKQSVIIGNYIDNGGEWAWPTNSGYKISSNYAWRWGKLHAALDISGCGKNSPIYAANDGVVVEAQTGTGSAWTLGKYVLIQHSNGIYTQYAHLNTISVSVGQTVRKGQVIGGMGETGHATGVHLHFAAFRGVPYRGGQVFNPMQLYK